MPDGLQTSSNTTERGGFVALAEWAASQQQQQTQAFDASVEAAAPEPRQGLITGLLNAFIVHPAKEVAAATMWLMGYAGGPPTGPSGPAGEGEGPGLGPQLAATVFPEATPEELQEHVMRGTALAASFLPGMAASAVATRLGLGMVGRAGSFLAGEALGGMAYGSLRPTEESLFHEGEETRLEAVGTDVALFTTLGAAFRSPTAVRGIRKLRRVRNIRGLRAARKASEAATKAATESVDAALTNVVGAETIRPEFRETFNNAMRMRSSQAVVEPRIGPAPAPPGFQATSVTEQLSHEFMEAAAEPRAATLPLPEVSGLQLSRRAGTVKSVGEEYTIEGLERNQLRGAGAKAQVDQHIPTIEELALADAAITDAVKRLQPLTLATEQVRRLGAMRVAARKKMGAITDIEQAGRLAAEAMERPTAAGVATRIAKQADEPFVRLFEAATQAETPEVEQSILHELFSRLDMPPLAEMDVRTFQAGADANIVPAIADDVLASLYKATPKLEEELTKGLRGQAGAALQAYMMRIASSGAGATMWIAGENEDESPVTRTLLKTVGAYLFAAGVGKTAIETAFRRSEWFRTAVGKYNALLPIVDPSVRNATEAFNRLKSTAGLEAKILNAGMLKAFGSKERISNVVAYALENINSAEFRALTAVEREEVLGLRRMIRGAGEMAVQAGIMTREQLIENYVTHLLPPESAALFRRSATATRPWMTRHRTFFGSLKELERWTKMNGVAGPRRDMENVLPLYLESVSRAIGAKGIERSAERANLLRPTPQMTTRMPGMVTKIIPDGWKRIEGVSGLADMMAQKDIANLIETVAQRPFVDRTVLNAFDRAKAVFMRAIMFWPWEHGFNAMRGIVGLEGNVVTAFNNYRRYTKMFRDLDPANREAIAKMREASGAGVQLFMRADWGVTERESASQVFDNFIDGVFTGVKEKRLLGFRDFLKTNRLKRGTVRVMELGEHALWDRWVPAVGLQSYHTAMLNFTLRNPGATVGSPAFKTAQHEAARFANNMQGYVNNSLRDPRIAFGMRQVFFSPSWMQTRLALSAGAAGDLQHIMDGKLNIRDAMYLKTKMRIAAWGVALSAGFSYGMTLLTEGRGRFPRFNPNNAKFYMSTGVYDERGREIGVDMAGWWQDDFKFLAGKQWAGIVPEQYLRDRSNPVLRLGGQTVTGRDFWGNEVDDMQALDNFMQAFGVPYEIMQTATRYGTGRPLNAAEAFQHVSNVLATGNVAAMPRPFDVAFTRVAERLLRMRGLPATSDRVYELARILRGNHSANNGRMIGNDVLLFLANDEERRRTHGVVVPLWMKARDIAGDLTSPR